MRAPFLPPLAKGVRAFCVARHLGVAAAVAATGAAIAALLDEVALPINSNSIPTEYVLAGVLGVAGSIMGFSELDVYERRSPISRRASVETLTVSAAALLAATAWWGAGARDPAYGYTALFLAFGLVLAQVLRDYAVIFAGAAAVSFWFIAGGSLERQVYELGQNPIPCFLAAACLLALRLLMQAALRPIVVR
jgi:hypothetical protein